MSGVDAVKGSTLCLVWHSAKETEVEISEPSHPLSDGLFLVRSERTVSRLYHAIKYQLPEGTSLIVAPLADRPKFKGMAKGAFSWVRQEH